MTAVDGEFLTLRGARPDTLKYPGAAQGLPDLWRAVEAAAQAVLGRTTIAELAAQGARADGAGREPRGEAGPARDVSPAVPASA